MNPKPSIGSKLKITAQDFHALLMPSECSLRVWLWARNEPESEPGEFQQVLRRLGRRHEAAHLATIPKVADMRSFAWTERAQKTAELVASHANALYQPVLSCTAMIAGIECEIVGEPDFLIRDGSGYLVRDVKLVRHPDVERHPEVLLQVQLYGWLFERVFGHPPVRLEVFSGKSDLVGVPYDERNVLRHLHKIVKLKTVADRPYSPVGWSKCTGCGFRASCWSTAIAMGDVAQVYGVDAGLAVALREQGIRTISQFVEQFTESRLSRFHRPWGDRSQRVGKSAGAILRSAKALLTNTEIILAGPAIPECDHFIVFDVESLPPQLDETTQVYLWGTQQFGMTQGEYTPAVAGFGADGDRQGWQDFLNIAEAIFHRHGDIPWIHWASYEGVQIREYIRRYGDPAGTAARVLENLLDLLPITRNSIVLPISSYSLKQVEKFINFQRSQSSYGGEWSMARYIEARETQDETTRAALMDSILTYNAEDLLATHRVFQWLRSKHAEVQPVDILGQNC